MGKKKKEKQSDNYGTEGMCVGMCLGTAISTAFGNNIGIGISLGMLLGLAIGTCIKKEGQNNDEKKKAGLIVLTLLFLARAAGKTRTLICREIPF